MRLILVLFALSIYSCATTPFKSADPKTLLGQVCETRTPTRSIKGSIWMKATSKEASGQFPATVNGKSSGLKLEVTNLLGATVALISVENHKYTVTVPGKKERQEEGVGYWGGIPLQWATDLFLGYTPCPSAEPMSQAKLAVTSDGSLVVDTPASLSFEPERFTYRFRKWAGKAWVESMQWQRRGVLPLVVDFKFDNPDESSGVPLKWEAKSPQGEVKIRWKDREMTR